jgi:large subunit ribosomal protein L34e
MPDSRWTRKGTRHAFNTKSQAYRPIRTPGGILTSQRLRKITKGPCCSHCRIALPGIPHMRKSEIHRSSKRDRTVSRAYGGTMCHTCVRQRIVRAFLLEEQKAVKKVLAERAGKK